MLLGGSNASTALTWVRPDLDKHLDQIRTQIEHIANSSHVGDGIENTAKHLVQLKYTFKALVLQGATLVVEEMITLCEELKHYNVRDRQKAFGALMDAIVVVPSYLDRLQAGHHDLPILLLPVINELRAAYNANIVSEATLFAPSLEVPLPELERKAGEHEAAFDESSHVFFLRMRRQWENALLRWLQHQEDVDLLSPLHSVCETLHRRVERMDLRRLWWIAAEVIGGLLDDVTDNDVHLRRLFARLHLNLKTLSESGEDATDSPSVNAISQALLFHIAQAKSGSAGVDMLRERFNLQELVPDRDVLIRARGAVTGRNRELYISLGAAVRDELSMVKDALDLELRTGEVESGRRQQSHEALLRLKDTLKMMGLGSSAQSIEELMPAFDASEDPDQDSDGRPREALLMGLAEKLIQVESVLEEQIATLGEPLLEDQEQGYIDLPLHEQRRIRSQLLDETVISLHQVQDGVRRHFDGEANADFTSPMEHIAGALELIGEPETASLALKLRNALGNLLRVAKSEAAVNSEKLETVTDAVAAFELYLAGCRDQQSNRKRFLEILKERLDRLPVGEMEVVATITPPPLPVEAPAEDAATPETSDAAQPPVLDRELLKVFLEEYETVVAMLGKKVPDWMQHQEDSALMSDIRRGFHTLKGSGRMVGADELGDFAWHIEEMLNLVLDNAIQTTDDVAVIVRLSEAILPAMKKRLLQQPSELTTAAIEVIGLQADRISRGEKPDWENLNEVLPATFASLVPGSKTVRPESEAASEPTTGDDSAELTLQDLVRKELADKLAVLNGLMDRISRDRGTTASDDEILAIHTIAGTTALEPLGKEADIARALEGFLETQRQSAKAFNDTAMWTVATSLAYFETCLAAHEGDPEADLTGGEGDQLEQLLALTVEFEVPAEAPKAVAEATETTEEFEAAEEAETVEASEEIEAAEETETVEATAEFEAAETTEEPEAAEEDEAEPVDTEILSIFLEEATDILERCDSLLNTWRDNLPDLGIVQNLQREIHTFKGGARMSGVSALGDLSHSMETLQQGCDQLNMWAEQASRGIMPRAGQALKLFEQQVDALTGVPVQAADITQKPDKIITEEPDKIATEEPDKIDTVPEELQEIPDVVVSVSEPEVSEEPSDESVASQHIRVNADLLDSLVNSAGEISIFRSRLEQQVGSMRDNLKEFDETVSRLREQFRKLEIETETQIRSRYHQEIPDSSQEFDPLEMDRFSSMQQLSRSLSESVADLLNLQELLDVAARKSEALLVQQSRASTELQEGLMQTRMVHFGTIAPRLRRIIRTAASETHKKARLQLRMTGGGDQLDRNVLERITAPLEHLLRNAIAHGIEKPSARRKLKKPEEGQLSITVASEATEFVVRVEDDGAGMNLKAIHKRAVELGLIGKKTKPQPQQLLQLILHSGFSTSKTVTALAGRGVGMDVVNSEIKQIGGSVEIASEEGKGTCFTIRIPFTLAVMQAIGVMAGEHRYLIPVASVTSVARMMPADYQKLLEQDKPVYTFADEHYSVLDLEPLLGEPSTPLGDDPISILMIKSGEQRAAFRVPELLGHREIVIKPVGPQISSVPGILGGTITGDGQVVIIIDAGPLIRQALLTGARPAPPMENIDLRPKKTLAMVVDDSITMRKVTSRVLEGLDFEVITAKDGVDATEQMRERIPDILLLDVEMPRMDGYELAEFVRADARLRHVPIVMITSRAGKKHRRRGKKAGANVYLSKPYQESELIAEVTQLLEPGEH
jgi:chemosensory pili system protein ChpA (sensor histidine kinase/response regulator)